MIKMSRKDFEDEHSKLIRILESGNHTQQTEEARRQSEELKEHLKKFIIRRPKGKK